MYGYRLTEDDSSEPMVYYNVRFRSTGSILTYPEWTVRYNFDNFVLSIYIKL